MAAQASTVTPTSPKITIDSSAVVLSGSHVNVRLTCRVKACRGSLELSGRETIRVKISGRTRTKVETMIFGSSTYRLAKGKSRLATLTLNSRGSTRLANIQTDALHERLTASVRGGTKSSKVVTIRSSNLVQSSAATGLITPSMSSSFSVQLLTSGNVGSVTFTTTSTNPYLKVSPSGLISTVDAPLAIGIYSVEGTDKDHSGGTGSWRYSLTVSAVTQSVAHTGTVSTIGSTTFTTQLSSAGMVGPASYTTTSSNSYLIASQSGLVSTVDGPLAAGNYSIAGTVRDAFGDIGTWSYDLTVTGETIAQSSSTTGLIAASSSSTFTSQISTSGNAGAATFVTTVPNSKLVVSGSGLILTVGGPLSAGVYLISGTDSDSLGDSGTWGYVLTVAEDAISVSSGSGQSAVVTYNYAQPLVATVTDADGNPVAGATVTFSAPTSGASVSYQGGVDTAVTGANGEATSQEFYANNAAGALDIEASTPTSNVVEFVETNTAGAPTTITTVGGQGQSAAVNTAFATPLAAQVTDTYGNPVPNVAVTFTAPSSGASATFSASNNTAVTASNGEAISSAITANTTTGSYNIVASASGTNTVQYQETNTAGTPSVISVTYGQGQSVGVGATYAEQLVATVTDAYGNPVPGTSVTFTAPSSGSSGTFGTTAPCNSNPSSFVCVAITQANGEATTSTLSANTTSGTFEVSASAPGTNSIDFAETNDPGTATTLLVNSGSGQSAPTNSPFAGPLVATVTDAYGNPVEGITVTFTPPSSGASAIFAGNVETAVTNANGNATSPTLGANSVAGLYSIAASAFGTNTVSFSETNTP